MRVAAVSCALGVAVASLVSRPAAATQVGGQVEIDPGWLSALEQRIAAQPNPPPPTSFWQVGNGAASVDPPLVLSSEELGILVRPVERRDLDPLSTDEPEILVRSVAFFPSVTYVSEGMSVVIRNLDLFDHDLVVEDEKGAAALPMEPLDGGRAFRVRFKARGVYVVRCKLFTFLRGYIVVDAGSLRFVRPDADGRFALGDLPAGKYTLTVFNATQMAATAPTPVAGWVTGACTVDIPAEPPAPTGPAAPAAPAAPDRAAGAAAAPAPTAPGTSSAAPPVFRVTVKLGGRGSTESLDCTAAWPPPPAAAPATPAAGPR